MNTQILSGGQFVRGNSFEGYFDKEPTANQKKRHKNIWFRVVVSQIPPRDSQFEYQLEMGRMQIEAVLEHKKIDHNGRLCFCFPERWMSQKEQYYFIPLLERHPSVVKAKMIVVDMYTMSPLIVGSLHSEDLRSLTLKSHVDGLSKATNKAIAKCNFDSEE